MKRVLLSGGVSALVLLAGLTVAPAYAAPAPSATPSSPVSASLDRAEAEKTGVPYLIKVGEAECPVIPKGSALSKNTERLFETLTNACLMKASGVITDEQFQEIRDQVVANISMQLATDSVEASTPSDQSLASNQ